MAIASLFEELLDQYRIEQHLAEKRYTDLYRAYDVDEDRPVRLDIMRPGVMDDNGFVGRFTHRARAVAQVRHPNISLLYDIGQTPAGAPYVTQAHVDGLPLSQRLEQLSQRATPVNTAYALKLVRQLADALVLAERLELFHYDLQPDNVWLKNVARHADDAVTLLDLFVPAERGRPPADAPAEKLAYLSPEQRAGRPAASTGHVFSLGVLLYRLLAGRLPDGPATALDVGVRRALARPTPLEQARPGLHPATYELVDRCLRREPGRRYESVEAFLVALNGVLAAEEANVGGAARPTVAHRSLALLLSLLVLALFLVAGAAAARGWRTQTTAEPLATAPSATIVAIVSLPDTPTPTMLPTATDASATSDPAAIVDSGEPNVGTETVVSSSTVKPPTLTPEAPTPTATTRPANTLTPSPEPTQVPIVHVAVNQVNLRRGPGLNFGLLTSVSATDPLQVIAWNNDTENPWYLVATEDQVVGWISGQLLRAGDQPVLAAVPAAATLPATPWPTNTPIPTPTRTPPVIVTATAEPGSGPPEESTPEDEPEPPTEAPTEPPEEPTLTPPPLNEP